MKHLMALSVWLAVSASPVWGAPQTVTLSVPGMTCSACPITVKVALNKTPGVEKAEVSYEKRQARVLFDDARTSVTALVQATANAGYPSSVVGSGK